jgi:hypothetical protein
VVKLTKHPRVSPPRGSATYRRHTSYEAPRAPLSIGWGAAKL